MKKILTAAVAIACATSVFAGGIDNKTNISTGYLRNPSRNAENERPEAVLYNIAGTGAMENGLYLNVGDQIVLKEYSNKLEATGTEYKDKEPVFLFPDFEAVYKSDNWAAYFGFGVFAGGGTTKYDDGTALTYLAFAGSAQKTPAAAQALMAAANNHSLEAYSVTFGEILGASYNINDNFTIAAAGRFLHGNQTMELKSAALTTLQGSSTIEYEASGYGFGGIFGINVRDLVPGLRFALQYQTITKFDMEFDSVTGTLASTFGLVEGEKFKNDLPAVLNFGAGYQINDAIDVTFSANYYFNKQAKMESQLGGERLKYDDSWEVALGVDYQIIEPLSASLGLMYSRQGTKDDLNSAFNPVLNSLVVGTGLEYQINQMFKVTGAYMFCKYFEKDYETSGYNMELNKVINLFSLGFTVKPF